MRIRPRTKHIIASELKHDAALAADTDVNRFDRRFWAELAIYQTSKNTKSPNNVRIRPRAKYIIAGELKHDAALATDIDVNRFDRRFWAELATYQTSKNSKLPNNMRISPRAKDIIASELKHDAALAAYIDVNRFGR